MTSFTMMFVYLRYCLLFLFFLLLHTIDPPFSLFPFNQIRSILFHSILFLPILHYTTLLYSTLYYSILFYSTPFHSILLYSVPFYSILFYSILFYSILFYSVLFYSILFYSILFYSIPFYSIPFYSFLYYTTLLYYILYYSILLHSILLYSIMFSSPPLYSDPHKIPSLPSSISLHHLNKSNYNCNFNVHCCAVILHIFQQSFPSSQSCPPPRMSLLEVDETLLHLAVIRSEFEVLGTDVSFFRNAG